MIGVVDWAASRARMVIAFIVLSLAVGGFAYWNLPKEGEPDIDIPALFVSVPFQGISASDSETLLVKPMETELADLDGLKTMSSTAAEGYAGVALEFEFGWDKTKTMADVRDAMGKAESQFPEGADTYTVNEINFSEFPIIIVNLTGRVPERTLSQVADDLQEELESLDAVLEAGIAGKRDEMLEVLIDPLRLESYNVTAGELINVVRNNNQLIAAGEIETASGKFAVKIPSSFDEATDVYSLPIKTNGDRVVTLGDLAEIKLTFEDRTGTARFNGVNTIALQVVKRKGFNLIGTAELIKQTVDKASADWPHELKASVEVGTSNDQSRIVGSMVSQLEGSVLTAVALVMIVVLAALGTRAALLVGFAIPTSFLLCFTLLGVMDITISNMVMFGLILAVGMLVDGAIVVVEYADKRIHQGVGPMHAYIEAAKRMFWPIISSTATTLCAFLPMLFWPGVPGQFMRMLPVTLIFVLSASLVVALIYLPVMGGVSGRLSRFFHNSSVALRKKTPWLVRIILVPPSLLLVFLGAMQILNPQYLMGAAGAAGGFVPFLFGFVIFLLSAFAASITVDAVMLERRQRRVKVGSGLSPFGMFIKFIAGNPIMPLVSIAAVIGFVISTFTYFGANNKGVEFFVESEPEMALVYVLAKGNLSLEQKDDLVKQAEEIVLAHPGITTAFAFAGDGGLNNNTGGAQPPKDTIGQIQLETIAWEDRPNAREPWFTIPLLGIDVERDIKAAAYDGDLIIEELTEQLSQIPGIKIEILAADRGPASAKPVHFRVKGDNWEDLLASARAVRARFEATPGLTLIEDTLPLPGIDWQIDVDVEKAGRYGADVATVGAMVQLVTRGILLDSYTPAGNDEEIDIRVRLPEQDRVLSTLDTLKVRTQDGLVPLSNFITRKPVPKLAEISRVEQTRIFDVKAGIEAGMTLVSNEETGESQLMTSEAWNAEDGTKADFEDRGFIGVPLTPAVQIEAITKWVEETSPFPNGIEWEWTGDQEDEAESQAFLQTAFMGALGLMFIILLAQFNSFYNSVLVLLAVVLSTTGVLIGMLVMGQAFSVIMTGTGIVALAGIVVNNNIVLIDTYQEYSQFMPRIEAIVRTAQDRIRPVLLTTITTMAGLAPMMFGLSLNFVDGGYSIDSPTALWWKQLATAVVFGLGVATVLTLVFTPSMLALRVWFTTYVSWMFRLIAKVTRGRGSKAAQDWALRRSAKRIKSPEILWDDNPKPLMPVEAPKPAKVEAAE